MKKYNTWIALQKKNMNWPKISIVTPTFNQGAFIEQTIKSVINQKYPNLEYIIMDGGSTDGTVEIIKRYAKHLTHWESAADKGQSDAINKGFARATGDILAWINSDDVYFPGALNKIAEAFKQQPDAAIYAGGLALGNTTGIIKKCTIPPRLIKYFFNQGLLGIGQPSSFFNTKTYRQIRGVDIDIYMRMDGDLMFRLLQHNPEAITIPDILSFFRLQPQSKSTVSVDRYREESSAFVKSIGKSEQQMKFNAALYKIRRLMGSGYLKSLLATYHYRGKNISDIWRGLI
jgi:glycosyltransferase involved in cell wall biosynthesis